MKTSFVLTIAFCAKEQKTNEIKQQRSNFSYFKQNKQGKTSETTRSSM